MERSPRYRLLPGWFRFFGWIYLIVGVVVAGVVFGGAVWNASVDGGTYLDIFGQRYQGTLRAWPPLLMGAVAAFHSYVALSLLWGRRQGRVLGLIACYGYLALWLAFLKIGSDTGHYRISLATPIFVGCFVGVLHSLKQKWNAAPAEHPPMGDESHPVAG